LGFFSVNFALPTFSFCRKNSYQFALFDNFDFIDEFSARFGITTFCSQIQGFFLEKQSNQVCFYTFEFVDYCFFSFLGNTFGYIALRSFFSADAISTSKKGLKICRKIPKTFNIC
jgi:hypothetical protein